MSRFDNEAMAEVYGRLTEALDLTVVHRTQPSRLSIHDGHSISINIEAQGESLFASGRTESGELEVESDAKRMSEAIKNIIDPSQPAPCAEPKREGKNE